MIDEKSAQKEIVQVLLSNYSCITLNRKTVLFHRNETRSIYHSADLFISLDLYRLYRRYMYVNNF